MRAALLLALLPLSLAGLDGRLASACGGALTLCDPSFDASRELAVQAALRKAKPNVKGKPRPPAPDALPTYELSKAELSLPESLPSDLVR
jgi:hypothetical protein